VIASGETVIVADFVSAPATGGLAVTFGPDVELKDDLACLGGRQYACDLCRRYPLIDNEVAGRWSSTYGAIQPTARVEVETPPRSPIAWSLSTSPVDYATGDQSITFEHGQLSVRWQPDSAELVADLNDGRQETRKVAW
jgi:hypothetical protein